MPFKIARNYNGKRVYNVVEEKTIRKQVEAEPPSGDLHLNVSSDSVGLTLTILTRWSEMEQSLVSLVGRAHEGGARSLQPNQRRMEQGRTRG